MGLLPIIVIGSSTGGADALKSILSSLPPKIPPIVIVQHVPKAFSISFVNSLAECCKFEIRIARNFEMLQLNQILIAPSGVHLTLEEQLQDIYIKISHGRLINGFAPSIDKLFYSASKIRSRKIVAALLTGMGNDGARGLLALRESGAITLAQDEESSTVYGMPKAAAAIGAAKVILSLDRIGKTLAHYCQIAS